MRHTLDTFIKLQTILFAGLLLFSLPSYSQDSEPPVYEAMGNLLQLQYLFTEIGGDWNWIKLGVKSDPLSPENSEAYSDFRNKYGKKFRILEERFAQYFPDHVVRYRNSDGKIVVAFSKRSPFFPIFSFMDNPTDDNSKRARVAISSIKTAVADGRMVPRNGP